jgi:hypothetical protein
MFVVVFAERRLSGKIEDSAEPWDGAAAREL